MKKRWILVAFLSSLQAQAVSPAPQQKSANPVVVASYNVDSYLTMPRKVNGVYKKSAGKPLSEKKALARVVADIHPSVLGLMEVGTMSDFSDLQHHLRAVGLDYPYSEYVQGADPERHLALLSYFPIVEHHSQGLIPLHLGGNTIYSPRGLLDVTLAVQPSYQLRVICLHLKSKIFVAAYNQAALREAEATFVHDYLHAILAANPNIHLLVMGDFNDTINSKPLLTILGGSNSPDHLQALALADDHNEYWTEYWKETDVYSRIDYILYNSGTTLVSAHSGIARPPYWNEASDHCALFTELQLQDSSTPTEGALAK